MGGGGQAGRGGGRCVREFALISVLARDRWKAAESRRQVEYPPRPVCSSLFAALLKENS